MFCIILHGETAQLSSAWLHTACGHHLREPLQLKAQKRGKWRAMNWAGETFRKIKESIVSFKEEVMVQDFYGIIELDE